MLAYLRWYLAAAVVLAVGPSIPAAEPEPGDLRAALTRSLPLLRKGAEGHAEQRTCFACHNQGVPLLALTTAHGRGLDIGGGLQAQREFIASFLGRNRDNYLKGKGTGGQVDTAGYALLALDVAGHEPDETTAAVTEYLLLYQQDQDHWRLTANRPPSEASPFTTNYLALRALERYGTAEQKDRIARRRDQVRAWLLKAPARDTEDRVFRLAALHRAGADPEAVQAAAQELLRTQRPDGGWAQTDQLESDAYATGSTLVMLHQAGGLATDDPAYRRGLLFLLRTQQADGSWHVRSRSRPFQAYYESGFPHGKDQFISCAATGWAATAMALALPAAE